MSQIVLFGDGKIAEELYVYFSNDSAHEVVGFTVDRDHRRHDNLFGMPVVDFEDVTERFAPESYAMFVAIGYHQLNALREQKFTQAKAKGYRLVSYVSSKAANIGGVKVGENSIVLEHATIQPSAQIGANVFVWSGNHVGHHAVVRDHCYIAGHVTIGGGADIGAYGFLGINATVGHNVVLGEKCLVGAGARVLKCADAGSVFIEPPTPKFRLDSEHFLKISRLE